MRISARRDLGFERIGTTTRFLAVGALVAGGVLSAAVAKALPGKSTHPTAPTQTVPTQTVPTDPGATSGTSLTAPTQAPQPVVNNPPVVSSGGS